MKALNFLLMAVGPDQVRRLKPVTNLGVLVSSTSDFHPDGLFSTEIFGLQGSSTRSTTYSYLNLRLSVIHPTVYKALSTARSLYANIMKGTVYAIWNPKLKDFVPADMTTGSTGYSFFMKHLKELKPEDSGSNSRKELIALLNKYTDRLSSRYLMVIPAGYRDHYLDDNGRPSEDEVNGLYRKVLNYANTIPEDAKESDPALDTVRYNIQLAVFAVDKYFENNIFGKHKFINTKWIRRGIHQGTRNVLTAQQHSTLDIKSPGMIRTYHTTIGLYQFIKATVPYAVHAMKNSFIETIFPMDEGRMSMTNKETLKQVWLPVDHSIQRTFTTYDAFNKFVNGLELAVNRDRDLVYKSNYYGLIYEGEQEYMLLQDIDALPERLDRELVRPLKVVDLLHLAIHTYSYDMPALVTRYPVLTEGGIYVSMLYLKTTNLTKVMYELDPTGNRTGVIVKSFPILSSKYYDSVSVGVKHLGRLGADHDGDTVSVNAIFEKKAQAEMRKILTTSKYYVGLDGKMVYSGDADNIDLTLKTLCM